MYFAIAFTVDGTEQKVGFFEPEAYTLATEILDAWEIEYNTWTSDNRETIDEMVDAWRSYEDLTTP